MRNLNRLTNYCNKVEAWNDWLKAAEFAAKHGDADLIAKFQPDKYAGWAKIDRATAKLKKAVSDRMECEEFGPDTPGGF